VLSRPDQYRHARCYFCAHHRLRHRAALKEAGHEIHRTTTKTANGVPHNVALARARVAVAAAAACGKIAGERTRSNGDDVERVEVAKRKSHHRGTMRER